MSIYEDIRERNIACIKNNYMNKGEIRIILGEVERLKGSKIQGKLVTEITDDLVIPILQKIMSSEKERLAYDGNSISVLTMLLEEFLPKEPTEEDIIEILNDIDFSKLKNKYQSIKIVKDKIGNVDGNKLKIIIDTFISNM